MDRRRRQSMEERLLRTGAIQPEKRRPSVPPFVRMVATGLLRFAALVTVAAGGFVGVALLIAWWRNSDLERAVTIGL